MGALAYYVSHADPRHYDPTNITFGIIPPLPAPPKNKQERALAVSARALEDLARWQRSPADVDDAPAEREGAEVRGSL